MGISSDGVVVGYAYTVALSAAIAWRVHDGIVHGPVILSPIDGGANGVASLGQGLNRAVGEAPNGAGSNVATAWDIEVFPDGSFEVIGSTVLVPDGWSRAHAITELGDICGILADTQANDLGWPDTAFVIRDGTLKTLPGGRRDKFNVGRDLSDDGRRRSPVVGHWAEKTRPGGMRATSWKTSRLILEPVGRIRMHLEPMI